jgi:hypothetical protein
VAIEDEAALSREQCRVWSWLEVRRDEGEISPVEFARALDELREPEQLSAFVITHGIPDAFGPVPAFTDTQRKQELDTVEADLRRTFLDSYGGRHVVVNRFVVLHVSGELANALAVPRRVASFGSRIWAQPARFTLVELEYAMLCLKRDAQERAITGLRFDIEHNRVVVSTHGDAEELQSRLRAKYGEMVVVG